LKQLLKQHRRLVSRASLAKRSSRCWQEKSRRTNKRRQEDVPSTAKHRTNSPPYMAVVIHLPRPESLAGRESRVEHDYPSPPMFFARCSLVREGKLNPQWPCYTEGLTIRNDRMQAQLRKADRHDEVMSMDGESVLARRRLEIDQ